MSLLDEARSLVGVTLDQIAEDIDVTGESRARQWRDAFDRAANLRPSVLRALAVLFDAAAEEAEAAPLAEPEKMVAGSMREDTEANTATLGGSAHDVAAREHHEAAVFHRRMAVAHARAARRTR